MTGASAAGSRRAAFRHIDWFRAAKLLAQGHTPAAVAEQIECSKRQLSRRRNHDPVFKRWIEECRGSGPAYMDDLRGTLNQAIEQEVRGGNVRVILWLADRLKLVTPPNRCTPEQELQALLGNLSQAELREFEELREPDTEQGR